MNLSFPVCTPIFRSSHTLKLAAVLQHDWSMLGKTDHFESLLSLSSIALESDKSWVQTECHLQLAGHLAYVTETRCELGTVISHRFVVRFKCIIYKIILGKYYRSIPFSVIFLYFVFFH